MLPRSMDARNRAEDLSSSILSSTSPPQIAAACSAIESFLHKHSSDQSRSFFSITFPSLICRLFGFDSSLSSWIDLAANNPDLASKLFALLSPDGVLLSSISAVDRHLAVKFVFPIERLPEWMRFVLQSDKYVSLLPDLCPLFKSRVKDNQIQLNVFEYYMFWFAYYPVCKGNSESSATGVDRRNNRGFRLERWTSSLPSIVSSSRARSGQKPECNLYLKLLYYYLSAFVPKSGLGSYQPYQSSLLHYSTSCDSFAFLKAEFLVYTLIHFWMVDNDFSPLPVTVCRSFGILFPFRAVLSESPPTPGLGEVLRLLVKYVNSGLVDGKCGSPADKLSLGFERLRGGMVSCESTVGSWNSVMQRLLYRFILRSFLFCPMGTSIKNAGQVFSLWVTYLTPWRITLEDFAKFGLPMVQNESLRRETEGKSSNDMKEGQKHESVYNASTWESYVASNYLFYSSLAVHFLGFAHKFLHTDAETVVEMVLKVLDVLTSSKELVDFLRKVDTAYHFKQSGPSSFYADNVNKYVASIREQLQDWEDGLCERDADGSFLHENWNRDLRLFSDGEDGAPKLLQLFILRAEHEIRATSGDLQNVDFIRSQMSVLHCCPMREPHLPTPIKEPHGEQHSREVFTPKHPRDGQHARNGVKYRGDWMTRPISDDEVAWLARVLIRLSGWLNKVLGLDEIYSVENSYGHTVLNISDDRTHVIGGPKEAFVMIAWLIGSWVRLCCHTIARFMRERRMTINLRVLSSKKLAMALVVYSVVCILKKGFWPT